MMQYDDEEHEAEIDESEDPDVEDADWNMDPAAVECPSCGREISEEAEWCPHCREYVALATAPARKPWWMILGLVLVLLICIFAWSLWW